MNSIEIVDLPSSMTEKMEETGVWKPDCPVKLEDLRLITFEHINFASQRQVGHIVMHQSFAGDMAEVLNGLIDIGFPIQSAQAMEHFNGSDVDSMNANNSSGFNGRKVMYTNEWSSHAYGAAVDINPLQNPYVIFNHAASTAEIFPNGGIKYLNRRIQEDGMVERIVQLFSDHGFTEWGGNWTDCLDYHHFQVSWDRIKELETD